MTVSITAGTDVGPRTGLVPEVSFFYNIRITYFGNDYNCKKKKRGHTLFSQLQQEPFMLHLPDFCYN